MIDLFNGSLYDILPFPWKTEDADAISYALQWVQQTLITLAKQTRLRADVDELPEHILDIMAVEMRAPYYDDSLPIETKRRIIKSTIRWHMHAGTPSAVRELLEVVFGQGAVIEWFDFEPDPDIPAQPFTFDIETNAPLRSDTRARLLDMLDGVKNVRSHLRNLIFKHNIEMGLHIGLAASSAPERYNPARETDAAAVQDLRLALSNVCMPVRRSAYRQTYGEGTAPLRIALCAETQHLSVSAARETSTAAHTFSRLAFFAETRRVSTSGVPDRSALAAAPIHISGTAQAVPIRTAAHTIDYTARTAGCLLSGAASSIPCRTNYHI